MTININIANFLSEDLINQVARETGFVKRKSPITGFNFLLTFSTGLINTPESTLAQLDSFLNHTSKLDVSPQAIDERINDVAETFLKVCLSKAMSLSLKKVTLNNELIDCFSHIYIIDSTNFMLDPSLKDIFKGNSGMASKSSMRIQFMYDYCSGKVYIQIGDTRIDDAKALSDIVKENKLESKGTCLFLQDLGYFKRDTFLLMDKQNHFFISKLKFRLKIHTIGNLI